MQIKQPSYFSRQWVLVSTIALLLVAKSIHYRILTQLRAFARLR